MAQATTTATLRTAIREAMEIILKSKNAVLGDKESANKLQAMVDDELQE